MVKATKKKYNDLSKSVDYNLYRLSEIINVESINLNSITAWHTILISLAVAIAVSIFTAFFENILVLGKVNLTHLGITYIIVGLIMIGVVLVGIIGLLLMREKHVNKRNDCSRLFYELSKYKFEILELDCLRLDNLTKQVDELCGIELIEKGDEGNILKIVWDKFWNVQDKWNILTTIGTLILAYFAFSSFNLGYEQNRPYLAVSEIQCSAEIFVGNVTNISSVKSHTESEHNLFGNIILLNVGNSPMSVSLKESVSVDSNNFIFRANSNQCGINSFGNYSDSVLLAPQMKSMFCFNTVFDKLYLLNNQPDEIRLTINYECTNNCKGADITSTCNYVSKVDNGELLYVLVDNIE